jgi:dihydrofolate reductase
MSPARETSTPKVIIDLSMSLDGFIAGPGDDRTHPLGTRGGEHIFDWYFSGTEPDPHAAMFKPEGANRRVVDEMFETTGAILTGRRTYDITSGWHGTHTINGVPVIVLTHRVPEDVPSGKSEFTFVTAGIEDAVAAARAAAGPKNVGVSGASAAQQCIRAGLVDELYLHVSPVLLGAGVRLFEHLGDEAIALEKITVVNAPRVTHMRFRVHRG